MQKATFVIAFVSLYIFISPSSVSADNLQYLGPNTTDENDFVAGNLGVLVYNSLCMEAFAGSQMCESKDILNSGGGTPPGTNVQQWIKPTIVDSVYVPGATDYIYYVDASGLAGGRQAGSVQARDALSCGGWDPVASDAYYGLVINSDGQYGLLACFTGRAAVACCNVVTGKK